jgi:transcriptional regulator with XRE-family HTH domain
MASEQFARNLAAARQRAGLTQKALASRASLHPTWVSHLESGRVNPTLSTIARLASALEVEPDDLLVGGDQ